METGQEAPAPGRPRLTEKYTMSATAGGRTWMRWAGVMAMAAGLGLGGCNSVPQDEYELALQENTELRQRSAQLESALQEANTRNASLEQENRDMAARLDQRGRAGDTGFEGIGGVGSMRSASGEVVVDIAGDVLFDSGSATLKASAKRTLDSVASVLNSRYGSNTIRVEGYTDTDPIRKSKWADNEALSAERALAVERYLVSKGVNNGRIYSAAFGPAKPKSSKQSSRRVEIVILGS